MSLAYCPHGRPEPRPEPKPTKAPTPRRRSTPPATTRKSAVRPAVSVRTKPRRWTPPEDFKPAIIVVLTDAGGELAKDAALAAIEDLVGDRLTEGDRQKAPTGELRWQLAARKARQSLIAEGRLTKVTPGYWTLA